MLFASQICALFGLWVSFLPFQHPPALTASGLLFLLYLSPGLLHFCHRRPFKSGRRANCGNNRMILLPLCHAGGPPYNSLFLSQVFFPPLGCTLIPSSPTKMTPQLHSLHCRLNTQGPLAGPHPGPSTMDLLSTPPPFFSLC